MKKLTEKELYFNLLSRAILELREIAYEEQNWKMYKIADLIHNAPGAIMNKKKNDQSYLDLLNELERKAQNDDATAKWYEHIKKDVIR